MDYEKKYKNALEKAKEVYNRKDATDGGKLILESMFPELKGSEDDMIREEIVDYLKKFIPHCDDDLVAKSKVWISWLEKQGEQNKQHLYDIIIALWNLLDEIDTFSDLQIDDTNQDNPFRKIENITQKRHKFVKSDGYDLFIEDFMITKDTVNYHSKQESCACYDCRYRSPEGCGVKVADFCPLYIPVKS